MWCQGRAGRKEELGVESTKGEFSVLSILSRIIPGQNAEALVYGNPTQLKLKYIHCRDDLLRFILTANLTNAEPIFTGLIQIYPWQRHQPITHQLFTKQHHRSLDFFFFLFYCRYKSILFCPIFRKDRIVLAKPFSPSPAPKKSA